MIPTGNVIHLRGKWGDALVLGVGALLPLSLSPFDAWWFAPLPLFAYLFLLQGVTVKRQCLRSFWFGLGYFGTGASWVYVSIHDYGYAPVPLAALLTLAFVAGLALAFALPMWLWHRSVQRNVLGVVLGFPAVWVLNEWYRSWFLTGFPWLYVGYSQTNSAMGGWAPVGGVYSIGFLLALLASSALYSLQTRKQVWLPFLVLAVSVGGGMCFDQWAWTRPIPSLRQHVVLVQGNVQQQQKWKPEQREAIRALYRRMSDPFWGKHQLIVWPEAAIPELYTPQHAFFKSMREEVEMRGGALITGVPSMQYDATGERVFHNSLLGLGEASGFYHKRRLVPFGEYVPLQQWLEGLLDFFKMPISEFSVGPDRQENLSTGMLRVASSICYEVTYPELVASQARDADVLLTVSNDTWFGSSIGPHQHLQMAQMRARENAREMLRATSNGISAFIDSRGRIVSHSPQFQPFVLQGDVQGFRGNTLYQLLGNWPVLFVCSVCILIAAFKRKHSAC